MKEDQLALTIFLVSGIVMLLFFGAAMLRVRKQLAAMQSWTKVPGTVLESSVTRWTRHHWQPIVRYRYEAGGRTYEGDKISTTQVYHQKKAKMEEVAARYPVGASIQVLIDPSEPGRSVLEPGTMPGPFKIMLGFCIFLILASLWGFTQI